VAVEVRVNDKVLWSAFPLQEKALNCDEDEILFGGARGGGKTAAGQAWLLTGNRKQTGHACDASYILHPSYRALVLRRNLNDLADWIAKAKLLYGQLGGVYTQRPSQFVFPSGATIVTGHLDDADAFNHYIGQEFSRLVLEELTQIPSEDLYLKVLGSLRSPHDELRCQAFLTTNPGGKGMYWVRSRFIEKTKPHETYTDPETGRTRIYIPAKVSDNPIYAQDRTYLGILMSLSPAMRRAWLDGDWDAIGGQYFPSFRTKPNESLKEPQEARHVWLSAEAALMPWYHTWLSADWGFAHDSAVYRYVQEPNGRIHVVDELILNQTTPEELGLEIGKFIWPALQQPHAQKQLTLYLSPDAFGQRTEIRTIADQLSAGIQNVLGADTVYILPVSSDSELDLLRRANLQANASVVIERAPNQRVAGWMYLQSLMRWWPVAPVSDAKFDTNYALELHRSSPAKYQEYLNFFDKKDEVLPKLVIHGDKCPALVDAIPKAVAADPEKGNPEDVDDKHFKGMDSLDSLRYGCFAAKFMRKVEPFEEFYSRRLATAGLDLASMSGDAKVWAARKAEKDYAALTGADSKPIHFNTSRARAHRRASPARVK